MSRLGRWWNGACSMHLPKKMPLWYHGGKQSLFLSILLYASIAMTTQAASQETSVVNGKCRGRFLQMGGSYWPCENSVQIRKINANNLTIHFVKNADGALVDFVFWATNKTPKNIIGGNYAIYKGAFGYRGGRGTTGPASGTCQITSTTLISCKSKGAGGAFDLHFILTNR